MEALLGTVGLIGIVLVGGLFALMVLTKRILYICQPNEVLILSGFSGGGRGYRVVKGGSAVRTPLFERVDRLDLTNMIIDVSVHNAYSTGGIPLAVQGVANVKIAGHDPVLDNAVERLLGKERDEISRMAKEILEGNLRGVLARLTPEEVNEDKLAFAEKLLDEAEPDLARLGIVLDTMKIQNVSDDRGYLDSIGRKRSAEIIKRSRIAEARAKTAAILRDAENRQRARLTEIESQTQIASAQADRRIADAKTRAIAMMAEATGRVDAEIAKATAALEAEEARVEQVRKQLEADVMASARADMEAGISHAKGHAAKILEEGRATVAVLQQMIAVWRKAGPDARDIFLMQKLQAVTQSLADTIGSVQIDRMTMLPGDLAVADGAGATRAVRLIEELRGALGVDLPRIVEDAVGRKA